MLGGDSSVTAAFSTTGLDEGRSLSPDGDDERLHTRYSKQAYFALEKACSDLKRRVGDLETERDILFRQCTRQIDPSSPKLSASKDLIGCGKWRPLSIVNGDVKEGVASSSSDDEPIEIGHAARLADDGMTTPRPETGRRVRVPSQADKENLLQQTLEKTNDELVDTQASLRLSNERVSDLEALIDNLKEQLVKNTTNAVTDDSRFFEIQQHKAEISSLKFELDESCQRLDDNNKMHSMRESELEKTSALLKIQNEELTVKMTMHHKTERGLVNQQNKQDKLRRKDSFRKDSHIEELKRKVDELTAKEKEWQEERVALQRSNNQWVRSYRWVNSEMERLQQARRVSPGGGLESWVELETEDMPAPDRPVIENESMEYRLNEMLMIVNNELKDLQEVATGQNSLVQTLYERIPALPTVDPEVMGDVYDDLIAQNGTAITTVRPNQKPAVNNASVSSADGNLIRFEESKQRSTRPTSLSDDLHGLNLGHVLQSPTKTNRPTSEYSNHSPTTGHYRPHTGFNTVAQRRPIIGSDWKTSPTRSVQSSGLGTTEDDRSNTPARFFAPSIESPTENVPKTSNETSGGGGGSQQRIATVSPAMTMRKPLQPESARVSGERFDLTPVVQYPGSIRPTACTEPPLSEASCPVCDTRFTDAMSVDQRNEHVNNHFNDDRVVSFNDLVLD